MEPEALMWVRVPRTWCRDHPSPFVGRTGCPGEGASAPGGAGAQPLSSRRLDFNGFYTERLERLSAERSQKAAPQVPVPRGPPASAPRVAVTAQ